MKNNILKITAAALSFLAISAFAHAYHHEKEMSKDIVDIAASNDDFSTLVTAVKAADLVSVLKGEGPFTVFAPTNDAFAALPEGTLTTLLKPENKDQLVKILTYHVVPGKVMAKDVKTMKAGTAAGAEVQLTANSKGVMVNEANVIKTDIKASNGVIHVIDKVILPPM